MIDVSVILLTLNLIALIAIWRGVLAKNEKLKGEVSRLSSVYQIECDKVGRGLEREYELKRELRNLKSLHEDLIASRDYYAACRDEAVEEARKATDNRLYFQDALNLAQIDLDKHKYALNLAQIDRDKYKATVEKMQAALEEVQ